jgi:hypothetical protein
MRFPDEFPSGHQQVLVTTPPARVPAPEILAHLNRAETRLSFAKLTDLKAIRQESMRTVRIGANRMTTDPFEPITRAAAAKILRVSPGTLDKHTSGTATYLHRDPSETVGNCTGYPTSSSIASAVACSHRLSVTGKISNPLMARHHHRNSGRRLRSAKRGSLPPSKLSVAPAPG